MRENVSIGIAALALLISVTHIWWTVIRRGTVRMTRPTVVFFGPDGGPGGLPKIFLRTLLFSTGQRGCVVENMYLRLSSGGSTQVFTFWGYGDGPISRGSGLFVGHEGVTCNHHFLVPATAGSFRFMPGENQIEVLIQILGRATPIRVFLVTVNVSARLSTALAEGNGVMFDWNPETRTYDGDSRSPRRESLRV